MPGTTNLLIIAGAIFVGLALIASAVFRLRKKLSAEEKPTFKTYVNEVGGYVVVGVILLIVGVAVLVSDFFTN